MQGPAKEIDVKITHSVIPCPGKPVPLHSHKYLQIYSWYIAMHIWKLRISK